MGVTLDPQNPCATAAQLWQAYADLVTGGNVQTVTFKGGPNGVEKTVSYSNADPARLKVLCLQWDAMCKAGATARPQRYAVNAGGRLGPQWGWPFGRTY